MRAEVWPGLALAALAVLYAALFRPGYSVAGGGDFALYLAHAQAIAEGRAYGETWFLYNPANAIMSPAAYPPGVPMLLAPVVAVFGLQLDAVKLVMVAALLATLWGVYRLALPSLGPRWGAVVVLAVGLSPAVLMRRDAIGSDMVFAAWCMLALLGARGRPGLLAVGVAMAILTRSVGVVLAAALALELVLRAGPMRRRLGPALVAGVAVAVVGTLWLRVDNATYAGYFARLSAGGIVRHLMDGAQAYVLALVELFGLSFGRVANLPVLLLLMVVLGDGLVRRLRQGPDAVTLFVLLYGAVLLAYPVHLEPTRYALPILPLLLMMAVESARARLGERGIPVVLAALAVLYGPFYATHAAAARPVLTADSPEFAELIGKMREAPAGTVFLAGNPRIFALYARRPVVSWAEAPDAGNLAETLVRFRPGYAIEERWRADALLAAFPVVYENPAYRLLAIPGAAPGR